VLSLSGCGNTKTPSLILRLVHGFRRPDSVRAGENKDEQVKPLSNLIPDHSEGPYLSLRIRRLFNRVCEVPMKPFSLAKLRRVRAGTIPDGNHVIERIVQEFLNRSWFSLTQVNTDFLHYFYGKRMQFPATDPGASRFEVCGVYSGK